jgi:hypothetical protein
MSQSYWEEEGSTHQPSALHAALTMADASSILASANFSHGIPPTILQQGERLLAARAKQQAAEEVVAMRQTDERWRCQCFYFR